MVTVHRTRMDATGQVSAAILNFFFQKEAETLDIPFTAQLALAPPLVGYEKANSAFG